MKPLVSVLTPTRNRAELIPEAIESALRQTYRPLEHVVVDDGSTDDTARIVEDYVRRHPDVVRLIHHADSQGPARRREEALALARGELVALLDDDDVWLPEKVERQVATLAERPRAGFSYTAYEEFDGSTGAALAPDYRHRGWSGELLGRLVAKGGFVCASSLLVRRDALSTRNVGFRDRPLGFGDDLYLLLALSLDWEAVYDDAVLVRYRQHEHTLSHAWRARRNLLAAGLLEEFAREFPEVGPRLGRRLRAGIARRYVGAAKDELRAGRPGRAAGLAAQATALHPPALAAGAGRVLANVLGHEERRLPRRRARRRRLPRRHDLDGGGDGRPRTRRRRRPGGRGTDRPPAERRPDRTAGSCSPSPTATTSGASPPTGRSRRSPALERPASAATAGRRGGHGSTSSTASTSFRTEASCSPTRATTASAGSGPTGRSSPSPETGSPASAGTAGGRPRRRSPSRAAWPRSPTAAS